MKDTSIRKRFLDNNSIISIVLVVFVLLFTYFKSQTLFYVTLGLCGVFVLRPEVLFPVQYIAGLSTDFFGTGQGFSMGRYLTIIFLISCVITLIKDKCHINGKNFLVVLILVTFSFFSTITGYAGIITPFFQMMLNLLVFMMLQEIRSANYKNIVEVLCISSVLCIILIWLNAMRDGAFLMTSRYDMNEGINSNNLAMMLEQVGSFCLAYVFLGKRNFLRICYLLASIGAVWLILLTGSRSAFIAIFMAFVLCMMIKLLSSGKKNILGSILLLVVAIFVLFYLMNTIQSMDNYISERFSVDDVAKNGGSGRADLINILLRYIFPDHFLFGSGMGTLNMLALGQQYGLGNAAHNIIIDPLTQMGVIGFGLFLFLLLIPSGKHSYILIRGKDNYSIIIVVVLLAAVFNGIGEIVFYEKFFWNDLALVALAYRQRLILNNQELVLLGKRAE